MTTVVSIVEGDGEVAALPILLRRICEWKTPEVYPEISYPIRVRRDRFLNKNEEFDRHLKLASSKCRENGWILILLDADDDCPAELSKTISERASQIVPNRNISVVLANKEYESWYIAGAESLNGKRGFSLEKNAEGAPEPEDIRNAKGWLSERMSTGAYKEVIDQPAFSAAIDLPGVFERSRSFRKLCSEWSKQVRFRD